jgi:ankyrin repeat protein
VLTDPDKDYIECLQTLSTLDWRNYLPSVPLPHRETLHWINENEVYNSWLKNTTSCTLHIHGRSGSGVSVLASFLSKLLLTGVPDATIINFSFSAEDDRQNSTHKMFVSLARQLLSHDPSSFAYVRYLYKLIAEELDWKIENIWAFFRSMLTCPRQRTVICIIDGADECDPSQIQYLEDLLALAGSTETNFKIIITSGAIVAVHPLTPSLSIDLDVQAGMRADVERIVASGISALIQRRPAFLDFKEELLRDLLRPGTTILTATLMLKRLEAVQIRSTPVSIRKELESLPCSLPEAYKSLIDSIPPESSSWAWKAISWVLHAFRPLKVNELALALAIERDGGSLPSIEDQVPRDLPRDLKHALGGLIRIQNDEVLLVHKSAKEFLLKGQDGPCHAMDHASIAQACLTYLSNIDPPFTTYGEDGPQICLPPKKHYDLLTYAVQHWPAHYRLAKDKSAVFHSASTFLQDKTLMHMWSELHWCQGNPATRRRFCFNDPLPIAAELGFDDIVDALLKRSPLDNGYRSMALDVAAERGDEGLVAQLLKSQAVVTMALHLAAQNGHLNVVSRLLAAGASQSAWDHTHSTPLHLAARSGYQQVVTKLLRAGSDPNASNTDGSSPLHLAAEFGHVEVILFLLDAGAILGMADKDGSTPLHLATKSGQLSAVKKLLGAKAEVDAVDHSGSTPLHLAVASGQAELVKALLSLHPSLSAVDHQKQTALHLAVLAGDIDVVEQLLDAGSDAKAVDAEGSTPLHMAASGGHLNVVRWFLRAGANPKASDNEGCFPLHLAARNGHLQLVKELLQANQDQGEASNDGSTPMHFAAANGHLGVVKALIDAKMSVTAVDNSGSSPLHLAAREGYSEMVKTLLSAEAASNITDHTNSTPLHLAAQFGHIEAMKALLGARADPEAIDQGQSRPLHLAAQSGHLYAVSILLSMGVDVDGGSDDESSPLHLAAKSGHVEIVKLLLARGADIEAKDDDGYTPLLLAAEEGHLDVVKELLGEKANVKAVNSEKRTALHFAAQYENPDVLAELLEKGANPKSVDSNKHTPLHLAAERGHAKVVKKLLAAEVELDMTDDQGRTALWLAASENHADVVSDLLNAGANGDIVNIFRATPLYVATFYGHVLSVQEILRHKVDIDFVGPGGWTALHAGFSSPELIKLIIGAGGEVDILGGADGTPLWLATIDNNLEAVRTFFELKANPISRGKSGSTPLHFAASSGDTELLQLFLDHIDFSPDVRDDSGYTPLREAIFHNKENTVKMLIDRNDVDINQKDDEGNCLVQLAIEMGHKEITNMLCDKGVDLTGPGHEVMMFASRKGDANGIQALMRRGVDPNKADDHGWTPALLASVLGNQEALDVLLAVPGIIEPSKVHPLRPTSWSNTDHSEPLELDKDCLTVKYITDQDTETLRERISLTLLTILEG